MCRETRFLPPLCSGLEEERVSLFPHEVDYVRLNFFHFSRGKLFGAEENEFQKHEEVPAMCVCL